MDELIRLSTEKRLNIFTYCSRDVHLIYSSDWKLDSTCGFFFCSTIWFMHVFSRAHFLVFISIGSVPYSLHLSFSIFFHSLHFILSDFFLHNSDLRHDRFQWEWSTIFWQAHHNLCFLCKAYEIWTWSISVGVLFLFYFFYIVMSMIAPVLVSDLTISTNKHIKRHVFCYVVCQ